MITNVTILYKLIYTPRLHHSKTKDERLTVKWPQQIQMFLCIIDL